METTAFSVFYSAFFDKMEQNRKFFKYFNLSDEEAMEIAISRAETYRKEAVAKLLLQCSPDVDFNDVDLENKCFNFKATNTEIELIANLMFEKYY